MKSNDLIDLIDNMIMDKLSDTHTITIAKILKVNSKTIDVKPIFKRLVDGVEKDYPIFPNVPPIFLQGGGNYHSFPLSAGDYCLLLVNERCLDNWYEGLDDRTPLEYRIFDYSDSFALVGINNKNNAITIPTDGRTNMIGDTYIEGNYEIIGNIVQEGNYTQTGNFTLNGNLVVNGNITINGGDLTIDGISFKNHIHSQANDSAGNTEQDTGVPK